MDDGRECGESDGGGHDETKLRQMDEHTSYMRCCTCMHDVYAVAQTSAAWMTHVINLCSIHLRHRRRAQGHGCVHASAHGK